jgi:hypothetical protein
MEILGGDSIIWPGLKIDIILFSLKYFGESSDRVDDLHLGWFAPFKCVVEVALHVS